MRTRQRQTLRCSAVAAAAGAALLLTGCGRSPGTAAPGTLDATSESNTTGSSTTGSSTNATGATSTPGAVSDVTYTRWQIVITDTAQESVTNTATFLPDGVLQIVDNDNLTPTVISSAPNTWSQSGARVTIDTDQYDYDLTVDGGTLSGICTPANEPGPWTVQGLLLP